MCDYHQMQSDLERRYQQFHAAANFSPSLAQRLSSPLLISVFENWINSRYRIIVVGQEVVGWNFRREDVEFPYYEWPYPFDICNFNDFKSINDSELAVKALVHGYREFDFSRHERGYNGPFWTAYRQLRRNFENDVNQSILWTNVFRMSIDKGSVINKATEEERKIIYKNMSGLLSDEISILNPKVVIFFTGPNYDEAIKQQFPDFGSHKFLRYESRKIEGLTDRNFPQCTIRTYHPNYLRHSRQWNIVNDIELFIRNNVS